MSDALVELGRGLRGLGYRFTAVTPGTQAIVNSRAATAEARSLRDVFGWNRPFAAEILPKTVFESMRSADVLESTGAGKWRSTVRFSTIDDQLFVHSAFPTDSQDAVFLGPDSVRFVNAIVRSAPRSARIADIGCGTGVGGIVLARRGFAEGRVVLADINESALRLARVNAELAGVDVDLVQSDVLSNVRGELDLVIANPPYLKDDKHRWYRDGAGEYGEGIGARMARAALKRLGENPRGGTLLLYTGAAIVAGTDTFLASLRADLQRANARYEYDEVDPDVFSDELTKPAYVNVERIAAVFLQARVGPIAR
ncbi:MAG TPA: class I SAM-dependent methyltransferase [Polyangiaceae bacterium]|nr:class I SAM-dependent methyltransferase [Polyangiaceae bacterium]